MNNTNNQAINPDAETQPHNNPSTNMQQPPMNILSFNQAHQHLNAVWRTHFTHHQEIDHNPPLVEDKMAQSNNKPWGPDAHDNPTANFRIYFQNLHGIPKVKSELPS
jgi:hypothetical protein